MTRRYGVTLLCCVLCLVVAQTARGDASASLKALDGTWIAGRADSESSSSLDSAWDSVFVIKDGSFKVTHFRGTSKDLVGTISLVPGTDNAIDLNVEAIDLSEIWEGVTYPRGVLPAIYKFD